MLRFLLILPLTATPILAHKNNVDQLGGSFSLLPASTSTGASSVSSPPAQKSLLSTRSDRAVRPLHSHHSHHPQNWKEEIAQILTGVIDNLKSHRESFLETSATSSQSQGGKHEDEKSTSMENGEISHSVSVASAAAKVELRNIADSLEGANGAVDWSQYLKKGDIDPKTKREVAAILNGILGRLKK